MGKNSKEFIEAKKLYYADKLPITNYSISFKNGSCRAKVVFGKGSKEKTIESNEEDFIQFASNFKTTSRSDDIKLVDISKLPVKTGEQYYKNIEIFTKDNHKELKEHMKEISANMEEFKDLDIRKGILDILNKNFDSEDAKKILDNYEKVKAILVWQMKPVLDSLNKIRSKVTDLENFDKLSDLCGKASLAVMSLPPIEAFQKWERLVTELDYMSKNFLFEEQTQKELWDLFYKKTGGVMEGGKAIYRILANYSTIYENIKDLLRDLAFITNIKLKKQFNDSSEEILKYLKENGYSELVEFIEPNLRHGKSHSSNEYRRGKLLVYDSSRKTKELIKEYTFQEVLDSWKKLKNLSLALLLNHMMTEQIITFRLLDSPDFKFFIIENKSK